MKHKNVEYMMVALCILIAMVLFDTTGCKDNNLSQLESPIDENDNVSESESEESSVTEPQEAWPTASAIIESMLDITLPQDAETEMYAYKIGDIGDQSFVAKAIISSSDLSDIEIQITDTFGPPEVDYINGIESDSMLLANSIIRSICSICSNYSENQGEVVRVYFRFGTGSPLKSPHQIYTTKSVYAVVLNEENGKNVVCFSYG